MTALGAAAAGVLLFWEASRLGGMYFIIAIVIAAFLLVASLISGYGAIQIGFFTRVLRRLDATVERGEATVRAVTVAQGTLSGAHAAVEETKIPV
jgi:hypothetical protein